jgi:hypothetical protein
MADSILEASLSFVDVTIVRKRGSNYFPLSYGGSKRRGEYERANAYLSSSITDQRNLKLCTVHHCDLDLVV